MRETVGILATALLGTAVSLRLARRAGLPRGQHVVLSALALDLWGGVVANNTRSCARWYERPGQGVADHLRFSLAHGHPFVIAWCDWSVTRGESRPWRRALLQYAFVQAATLGIRRAAPRHRRTAGLAATVAGLALDAGMGRSAVAPWFGPVLFAKLLLGHASAALWSDADLVAEPTAQNS